MEEGGCLLAKQFPQSLTRFGEALTRAEGFPIASDSKAKTVLAPERKQPFKVDYTMV